MAVLRGDGRRACRRRRRGRARGTPPARTPARRRSCRGWSSGARCLRCRRSRSSPRAHACATSGSSDAVGSSSTSSRGRCSVDAHDADQRALPRRQLGAHRVGEVRDPEPLEPFVDARLRIGEAVELAVERRYSLHPHALGERQIAGREADALGRFAALARRDRSRRSTPHPRRARTTPRIISSVVVLPAPFGPRSATRSPACTTTSMPSTARLRR